MTRFKNHETPAGKASSEDPAGDLCRGAEEMPAASECIYEPHLMVYCEFILRLSWI
ncbi:hypothetical protein K8O68_01820 [Salipaludibacillus sp. CUR1]|uniref:hypothetical protein n=1 Tax=Salipaludibacillus sp. CUR1 TaxID=2820003 RepID=UPI001E4C12CE|nr:hypothetical protein [Salipaludibacillus sp. CUR1]MCE7791154.1 hypothetical protein [Salipaludibacillus sp. CUR1]